MLPKTRRPPELRKDRPDQIVFGLAFIGRTGDGEDVENVPGGGFEGVELTIIDNLPVGRSDDRFANKIVGEKTSMERIIDTHAAGAILITLILPHLPHSPKATRSSSQAQAVWRQRAIWVGAAPARSSLARD